MVKKCLSVLLVIAMLFSLTGCSDVLGAAVFLFFVVTGDDRADKDEVFEFVCENEEALLQAIEKGEFSSFANQGFIGEIDADEDVVDFACGGFGVGSGTSYVGFFYTPHDDMAGAWCAPFSAAALIPDGDGFAWHEADGDNQYYVEHICGHFYYYEASF